MATAACLRFEVVCDDENTRANASLSPATAEFIDSLDADFFGTEGRGSDVVFVSRAPGRMDVMGGIADYSGSLVLQMPLAEACHVAVRPTSDGLVKLTSASMPSSFVCHGQELAALEKGDYSAAQAFFKERPGGDWAAYVAGCLVVLANECGFELAKGMGCRVHLHSAVPVGMGVSSSAAIEVATMHAMVRTFSIDLGTEYQKESCCSLDQEYDSGVKLAMLCQKVENLVVGAPCGIMDQIASNLGQEGKLLALLCRPAEIQGLVEIPNGMEFWGIDSGHRHNLAATTSPNATEENTADYSSVRIGAFMGKKIWNSRAVKPIAHLTELAPSEVEWAALHPPSSTNADSVPFPIAMGGAEFLAVHGTHEDPVTTIEPDRSYAIRMCACHPVYEHARVCQFEQLLQRATGGADDEHDVEPVLSLLGELMRQAHVSYSRCGLGSSSTDRLVELAHAAGPAKKVYGAKITGGGSGGTVCLLTASGAEGVVREIAAAFASETGHTPHVFRGSGEGGDAFGVLQLRPISSAKM